MTIIYQLLSTAIIGYVCTTMGILYTYPSSTLKLFSSENTTLDRVMSETEISLMGSISSASTLIVTPFCGYLLDKLGRKRTLILFYLPQLVGWMVLVTISKVEAFILGMFLCGLSGSIFLIVPVYVSEFCDPSIRGALSSSAIIFNGVGMLISYLFGGLLEYHMMNYAGLTLTIVGIVMVNLLNESPLHLMKKGYEEEAALSIAFYKGAKPSDQEVLMKMDNIRRLLNFNLEQNGTPEEEKLKLKENKPKENLKCYKYLVRSPSTRRALFRVLVLMTSCIFQGIVVVQIFAGPLFESASPSMTGTLSSVLFGTVSVGTGLIGAYLSDKLGRRILLIAASVATGLFCVTLGINIQFSLGPNWLNALLLYLYTVTYTIGPATVPSILIGEVFLPEIKAFASTVCMEWAFTCNFIILFMFNTLFKYCGLGPLFYLFAGFSLFTTIFSFIYLPETKGLPVDVIQQKMLKR